MRSKMEWSPTVVLGWVAAISAVIAGVAPILPPDAPPWLHQWLPVIGVLIGLVTQSIRKIPPTEAEAVAVLEGATPIAIVRVGGSAVVTVPDVPRETLPPAEPQ